MDRTASNKYQIPEQSNSLPSSLDQDSNPTSGPTMLVIHQVLGCTVTVFVFQIRKEWQMYRCGNTWWVPDTHTAAVVLSCLCINSARSKKNSSWFVIHNDYFLQFRKKLFANATWSGWATHAAMPSVLSKLDSNIWVNPWFNFSLLTSTPLQHKNADSCYPPSTYTSHTVTVWITTYYDLTTHTNCIFMR